MNGDDQHIGPANTWSYACGCIRCRWEQWWNEGDNDAIPMPDEPHPDGEFKRYWDDRQFWLQHGHHPRD